MQPTSSHHTVRAALARAATGLEQPDVVPFALRSEPPSLEGALVDGPQEPSGVNCCTKEHQPNGGLVTQVDRGVTTRNYHVRLVLVAVWGVSISTNHFSK